MVETPRLADIAPRRSRAGTLRVVASWLALLGLCGAPASHAQPDRYVPGQVIVKLVPTARALDAKALQAGVNATVRHRFESIGAELWEAPGADVADLVARLQRDPRVLFAEPNYIVEAAEVIPDDVRFPLQWNMHNTGQDGGLIDADIDAPEAWEATTGGDVLVGVIDTGVDWHHADLAPNIFVNPGEIPDNLLDDDENGFIDDVHGWDFVNDDNDPSDDHGHGTHVSGIVAAVGNNAIGVAGASWSARIMPLKFLSAIGLGATSDAIRAIEYATMMGARLTNNSWGGANYSQALYDAIAAAEDAGILFVAASGNVGINVEFEPFFPASHDLDNIISVASTDRFDQRSLFSNFGPVSVDLAAPGSDIVSTFFLEDRYAIASGTSMAAPHVAGAVCLVWAAVPALTAEEVKSAILSTVDRLPSLQGLTVTGGRLNLGNIMRSLDDDAPAPVADLAVTSTSSNTVFLSWTASGDDGGDGTARRYDLRYATTPIDADNFDQATPVANLPQPKPAGSAESFEVPGLAFTTTYYFALVVEDDLQNRSSLSNVASGTTLGIPGLVFAPGTFEADLLTGGTSVQSLIVVNTAQGTLDFSFANGPSWFRADPPSGRVAAGDSSEVEVTLDATGVFGGEYSETVDLRSNDPAQPAAPIALTLRVTGAPDVRALPSEIDFGVRYAGTCATDTLVVSNIGAEPLVVGAVTVNHPDFSIDTAGFTLAVGDSRGIAVTYCPLAEDPASSLPIRYPRRSRAVLWLASNDPDRPSLNVPIFGEAIGPPAIAVSPASSSADLFTGELETHVVTVSNHGVSPLDFEIVLEDAGGALQRVDVIGDASIASDVRAVGRPLARDELAALSPSVPTSVKMPAALHLDREATPTRRASSPRALERVISEDREEVFGSDQNEFFAGPRTRGNLFTCLKTTTLQEHRFYLNPSTATQMWFVVYEGETQEGVYFLASASNVTPAGPGLGWYSSGPVSVPMHAGKFYLIATAFEDPSAYYNEQAIAPFPIPTSFGQLSGAAGWAWEPYDQFPPAPFQFVTNAAFGAPVAYYQTLVTGDAIRWVDVASEAGTLQAGTAVDIALEFDASGMPGGDYDARIRVRSNDPVTPEVVVPLHAHITAASDIAVSETSLDFGGVFVGTSAQDTLIVSNTGTDFLFVSGITSSRPEYTVDASAFVVAPGTRRLVVVTVAPTVAGALPATLSIASIDPDEGVVEVAVSANATAAPVAAFTPSAFSIDLPHGETATPVLTVANSGGSDLVFEIDTALDAPPVRSVRVEIPRSAGDFPRGTHPASFGAAPVGAVAGADPEVSAGGTTAGFAFATETQHRRAVWMRLDAPETLDRVANAPRSIWAGDFGVGDNSFAYAINDLNQFMTIDTLTGAQTVLGTLPAFETEVWSGMALDPTDGTMYAAATDGEQSSLYVVDVEVPSTTRVGAIGFSSIVAIAVDDDGTLFAEDVVTDQLVAVDKTTGAGTAIGSLGFDSNFGQGMAFDPASGQLYLAAFNNFRFQSELRVVDRATGATAVVGRIGAIEPGGLTQLGWLGIPGLGGVPWLRASPRRGVVAPGTSVDVAVRFDAGRLNGGDYGAALHVSTNDPSAQSTVVPALLHVTGIADIEVSATSIDFGDVFVGGTAKRSIIVANVGTDVLEVASVGAGGDFAVDPAPFLLAPGASRELVVTAVPTTTGLLSATLAIASDDPDEGTVAIALSVRAHAPPVMSVSPSAFTELLSSGQVVTRALHIDNTTGAADLVWNAGARFPGDAASIVAASPVHRARGAVDLLKEARLRTPGPGASALFAFAPSARPSGGPANATSLETILASLDANVNAVTSIIPERWDFFDGFSGDGILDGGYDMFDGGNYLSTDVGGTVFYTNGVIFDSESFGATGRYFTRKYPGLFVLAAETDGIEHFQIDGNLGADGFGAVDGAVLHARVAGSDYLGFVKRVFDAGDPSVNHLIIVPASEAASHEFVTDTNNDYHRAFHLASARRLYYLLYAGWNGAYIDDATTLDIMEAFLHSIGITPDWVRIAPSAGVVPAGSAAVVDVVFDAVGRSGDFAADVVVAGNDPITPEVAIPATLHVDPAPEIAVSPSPLQMAPTFVGASRSDTLVVSNLGTQPLVVTGIVSNAAEFAIDGAGFAVAPGADRRVGVLFAPAATGVRFGTLSFASNDPDEGTLAVVVFGSGLEAPAVVVTPESLADSLVAGDSSTRTLSIANYGGHALDVQMTIEGVRLDATNASVAGGGPDYFGFRWEDSDDAGGPTFAWIDASGGTDLAPPNDGVVTGVPLGFTFHYYGWEYTTINAGAEGWLSFNSDYIGHPTEVPKRDFYAGVLAPYARDLDPAGAAYVRYVTVGVAPDRRFVIEYNGIPDADGTGHATFEVILYERTHSIRFQYLTAPNAPEGFGIESPDESLGMGNAGTDALFIDPAQVHDAYAIEFIAPPSWLSVSPTGQSVAPGSVGECAVRIETAGLAGGRYRAQISLHTNDPVAPTVVVPVILFVDTPQSVAATGPAAPPTRYELHANRPNPFNPTTTIDYDLPHGGRVQLTIYDVRGRPVRALVDATQPAGSHRAVWDGRDAHGQIAASGVYFYRLVADEFVATKKMVLLK